jgi:ribosomal protein uL23
MKGSYSIIKYPLNTEKTVRTMEKENKLLFVVDMKADKQSIKNAIEDIFKVKVSKVNTHITAKGEKRAYVTLSREFPAMDVLTKLGLM